jgi:hypothetical protein
MFVSCYNILLQGAKGIKLVSCVHKDFLSFYYNIIIAKFKGFELVCISTIFNCLNNCVYVFLLSTMLQKTESHF